MNGLDDEEAARDPARAWIPVGRWPTAARADEFALVLDAVGIRSAVVRLDDDEAAAGYGLIVALEDAGRAREQLARFVGENQGWPPRPVVVPPMTTGVGAALVYAALLVIAFLAERQQSYGVNWLDAGAADAGLIRGGEWWRAVTALSLHADFVHLGGNLLFGALFGLMLAQTVGAGSAWLIFIAGGAAGNALNALSQAPSHVAIGASTGVFALLGAQAACDWMRRGRIRRHPMRRAAPIIMGVALLAWLGGSGGAPEVDIGAHLWGFAAGLGLGLAFEHRSLARLLAPSGQRALVTATLALFVAAWGLALW